MVEELPNPNGLKPLLVDAEGCPKAPKTPVPAPEVAITDGWPNMLTEDAATEAGVEVCWPNSDDPVEVELGCWPKRLIPVEEDVVAVTPNSGGTEVVGGVDAELPNIVVPAAAAGG